MIDNFTCYCVITLSCICSLEILAWAYQLCSGHQVMRLLVLDTAWALFIEARSVNSGFGESSWWVSNLVGYGLSVLDSWRNVIIDRHHFLGVKISAVLHSSHIFCAFSNVALWCNFVTVFTRANCWSLVLWKRTLSSLKNLVRGRLRSLHDRRHRLVASQRCLTSRWHKPIRR